MYPLTFKYPKARKQHTCEVCGSPILKGQTHHYQSGVYDGSWQDWRVHSDCAELHWHHNDGRSDDDQVDDYYLDEYRGLWPHAVCRIELLSHKAQERLNEERNTLDTPQIGGYVGVRNTIGGHDMKRYTDQQYNDAVRAVVKSGRAATSFVSRELSIPYLLAVDIMLDMERNGVVSEPNHVGKREVLISI